MSADTAMNTSHPVFDRVHRLALQLHSSQDKEKFELCESLAALLNNIAQEVRIKSIDICGGWTHGRWDERSKVSLLITRC